MKNDPLLICQSSKILGFRARKPNHYIVRLFTQLYLGKAFRNVINNTLQFDTSIDVYSSIEASSQDVFLYNQPLMHVDRYDPNAL
jgi:hypothetical protein